MRTLYLIPARGGSKRIPDKNIKALNGIPLIHYTINVVQQIADKNDICVSTDSDEIIAVVEAAGVKVPFKRPQALSTDKSGSQEVILHALDHYASVGREYDNIMLLQPTSPFRRAFHLQEVAALYEQNEQPDLVVSVGEAHHNPYFSLFEENSQGYLEKSKTGNYTRMQDAPPVYYFNGSIYLINSNAIRKTPLPEMKYIKKYVMEEMFSVDIDTHLDWLVCETIIKNGYYTI